RIFGDLQTFRGTALVDVARDVDWQQLGLDGRLVRFDEVTADLRNALRERAGGLLLEDGYQLAGLGDGLGHVLGASSAEVHVVERLFDRAHLDLEREAALRRRFTTWRLDFYFD